MSLAYRKRVSLWRSKKLGVPAADRSELYLTVKIPTRRRPSPIGIGFRYRGITWNTSQGFASARTGIPGLTWRDRD